MDTLNESPYDDNFSRPLTISVVFHILLFLFFAVKAAWVPNEAMLIRSAIRVDMVALPDKMTAPESKSAPQPVASTTKSKPAPVVEAAKPKVVPLKKEEKKSDLKKIQETQRQALEQLKAQNTIEKMKKELLEKNAKPAAKAPNYAGNVLNKGDGLTGLEKIEFDRYFGDLEKKIKQHWSLPGWLIDSNLRAQALVFIGESGQVVKRQILTSSGNSTFDEQVLTAVDNAAPFSEPPARLKDVLALKGIVFNFPE